VASGLNHVLYFCRNSFCTVEKLWRTYNWYFIPFEYVLMIFAGSIEDKVESILPGGPITGFVRICCFYIYLQSWLLALHFAVAPFLLLAMFCRHAEMVYLLDFTAGLLILPIWHVLAALHIHSLIMRSKPFPPQKWPLDRRRFSLYVFPPSLATLLVFASAPWGVKVVFFIVACIICIPTFFLCDRQVNPP